MSDEVKDGVTEPVAQVQEAVATATESTEEHNDRPEEAKVEEQPKRRDADYNWAEMRRKTQELERRASEQEELIKRLSKGNAPEPDDNLDKLSDDDIITVAQHKRMSAKIAKQVAEEVVRQREALTVEDRLVAKFPDFNSVVTSENIELLKQNDPELALSLQSLAHDPYAQSVAAYKLFKRGPYVTNQNTMQDKKKAEANAKKPLSVQAAGKQGGGLGDASMFENGLTKDLQKKLWSEMQECIKRA